MALCETGNVFQYETDSSGKALMDASGNYINTMNGKPITESGRYQGHCCTTMPCDTQVSCTVNVNVSKDSAGNVSSYSTTTDKIASSPPAPNGLSYMILDHSKLLGMYSGMYADAKVPVPDNIGIMIKNKTTADFYDEYGNLQQDMASCTDKKSCSEISIIARMYEGLTSDT